VSLDALGGPKKGTAQERQVNRSGHFRANDWLGPVQAPQSAEEHVQGSDRALLAHLALPVLHPLKRPFAAIGLPAKGWSNVMLAAALVISTTASAYVIRPDRDMRQFDGSIV
jgi:hypothetical protein